MTRRRPLLLRLAAPTLLLTLALPLAACAGSTSTSDSGASGSSASDSGGADSESEPAPAPDEGGDAALAQAEDGAAGRAEPMQRAVVSTGRLDLRTDDVARARARALSLVQGWGGLVADEEASSDEGEVTYTTMTLRVPSERFAAAMTDLAGLGEVQDQSRSAEDVTTEVVDVGARVRAQERSVRRIEQLLAEAEDLGDVIAIESDLARRQADLDSLKSQQAYLDDQTSLSTISLTLDREPGDDAADDDATGFLAGLDSGWSALLAATTVLATAAGAVLPFAALVLVLGVPLLLVVRRRRGRDTPPAEAAA